ncbi:MAG: hypothetical protein ACK5AZ_06980 [Bryobacteraceae bacterium]
MRRILAVLLTTLVLTAAQAGARTFYLTVAGLGGEPDYEQRFANWAKDLEKILKDAGPDAKAITLYGPQATRERLRSALGEFAKEAGKDDALVVMLIGHGSFDGYEYKLNLPGPDITDVELAELLDRVPAERQLVVNMSSASGGSTETLRKENRIVITATRSGREQNATVFARYWVEALRDPAADADKNEMISALEAFRYADQKTAQFYETQKRIATEHPLIEDTGKGEGVRAPSPENGQGLVAARFPVLRLGDAHAAARDPKKQKLFARKEQIEQEIDRLKYQKAAMPIQEYRKQLSALLLELAKTQAELDQ